MFDDLYQEIILDHYKNPRHHEDLSKSGAPYLENPTCGDSVALRLEWDEKDCLKTINVDNRGCAISSASGSMMSQLLLGKTRGEVEELCHKFIAIMRGEEKNQLDQWGELEALSGVIRYPARVKCATLPWHALEKAL